MGAIVSGAQWELLPGFALAETYRVTRHAMDGALRELDLTTPQWGALACIGRAEGLSGAEMARIRHLTPQTMHTILHNLEQRGLVIREKHPEHGTLLCVRLTDEGRQRLDESAEVVRHVHTRMVAGLDEQEQRILVDLLHRCTAAFGDSEQFQLEDCPLRS